MTEAEKTHSYKKKTALTQPRVVIIGGGFGGLYAARGLAGGSRRYCSGCSVLGLRRFEVDTGEMLLISGGLR